MDKNTDSSDKALSEFEICKPEDFNIYINLKYFYYYNAYREEEAEERF
jgi:hypothetical protein